MRNPNRASPRVGLWARAGVLTALLTLGIGVAAVLAADFGMAPWFFWFTQLWFWTVGLPALVGVLALSAAWGIPGWTTWPAWAFLTSAAVAGVAVQTAVFWVLGRVVRASARAEQ